MKLSTFQKRTKTQSKGSKGYQFARELMTTGKPVNTAHYSGRGRYTTLLDYTNATIDVLRNVGLKQGIDFVLENNAPKGSATGNYISLTAKGRRKIIK